MPDYQIEGQLSHFRTVLRNLIFLKSDLSFSRTIQNLMSWSKDITVCTLKAQDLFFFAYRKTSASKKKKALIIIMVNFISRKTPVLKSKIEFVIIKNVFCHETHDLNTCTKLQQIKRHIIQLWKIFDPKNKIISFRHRIHITLFASWHWLNISNHMETSLSLYIITALIYKDVSR